MSRDRLVAVLVVLVLLGSGLSLALALTKPGRPDDDGVSAPRVAADGTYLPADFADPGGAALAAATVAVRQAGTYDYRNLRGSLRSATSTMTAGLARSFTASFRASSPRFVRNEEVTDARVVAAGLVATEGPTRVRCLLYVSQRVVRSTPTTGRLGVDLSSERRLSVEMVLRDGTWRLAAVTSV